MQKGQIILAKIRLQHASLPVPAGAQEAVRAFYGGVLGLEEKPCPRSLAGRGLVWFAAGDGEMELHFIPDPLRPHPDESRHICLEVEDVESYRRRLVEAGHEIIEAETIPNRPRFFSRDPFGNRVEFTTILGDYREA